ncbi:(Dimethylallyl)adenosine tRNA methylthiotransferase MiaB [Thalassoglobus neptunius]|uniref:tRNA-2-methylthio-N(6)-dimethylallyladenosine synthase n=1 Tax=Thalassoglobus neptunius TaxID=1938619 RepID=A0A5C5VQB2_9PLAN|nr:(Dimethylallyl)adenosine tRNA methylthiotransferase MiaB [Thalassoglobus neptunius]
MSQSNTPHNGKLYIETVGCQMNVLDSELVVAALKQQGYDLCDDPSLADTVLFNTCSVREHAEHKTYSSVGRFKYGKRKRPNLVIGVIGCMAQQDQDKVFQKAPHVDLVVGTGQLAEIPALVDQVRSTRKKQLAVSLKRREGSRDEVAGSFESYDPLRDPTMRPSPWQAFVRIMIGCDKFCTYCVVPNTRGPEQSRSPAQILSEVKTLANQGVKEITFLGQTVNSYAHTEGGKTYRLSDLIALVHDTPGIERIKFVTNYPKDMTVDLLDAMRDLPKVSRYLHVPLQHGCDSQLKLMKRGYTVADYRDMMGRIREYLPDCSVSSDFIVGFCQETEEAFQKCLDAVNEFRFKNSFIFKYSPRPGTKAFDLYEDDVPEKVKKRRNNELLKLQNEISGEDNAQFIGRRVEVLVEGPSKWANKETRKAEEPAAEQNLPGWHGGAEPVGASKTDETPELVQLGSDSEQTESSEPTKQQLVGRTKCDRIVVFDGNLRLSGTLADIEVYDVTQTTLLGEIVTHHLQPGSSPLLPILG